MLTLPSHEVSEIAPFRLERPEATRARLRTRLEQPDAIREACWACGAFGASWPMLHELLDHFTTRFALERQPLFGLPCFEVRVEDDLARFVHARSNAEAALPLLLLHGYSASLAEFQDQIPALTAGAGGQAFHVVCPSLPGFGLSSGAPSPEAAARLCATLMARLGYTRYLVHGSDLGARVALELAALDAARVAAVHVTSLPARPDSLAALTPAEKSRLLRLAELEQELDGGLPETPIAELGYALSRADDELGDGARTLRDGLLTGWVLSWALCDQRERATLHARRLEPAPRSRVPIALHAFPLDVPSLRRFASERYRIAEWHEHELGGSAPALERPELWLTSICSWAAQLR